MPITKRDKKGRIAKGSNKKHGLSDSPIYDCWIAMKARCQKEHHPCYKHYGGRGIKVCERWGNFDNFFADMGNKPSSRHTLDRINNDGDYEPTNCRWITIQEQQKNKRDNNEIVGVVYEKNRKKWRADICAFGKKHFLGRFAKLEEAVEAREKAEGELWVL